MRVPSLVRELRSRVPRGQKKKMSQVYILESDGAKRFINSSFTSFLIAFPAFKVFSAFFKEEFTSIIST